MGVKRGDNRGEPKVGRDKSIGSAKARMRNELREGRRWRTMKERVLSKSLGKVQRETFSRVVKKGEPSISNLYTRRHPFRSLKSGTEVQRTNPAFFGARVSSRMKKLQGGAAKLYFLYRGELTEGAIRTLTGGKPPSGRGS